MSAGCQSSREALACFGRCVVLFMAASYRTKQPRARCGTSFFVARQVRRSEFAALAVLMKEEMLMETTSNEELGATDGRTSETPSLADQVGAAFSARMNERIRTLALTNAVVSARCGYAESTVRKWRKGKSTPDLVAIHALAGALGVSPEWLGGGTGDVALAPERRARSHAAPATARDGAQAPAQSRTMEEEDVRIFFGVVSAVQRLEGRVPEPDKAEIAVRMRHALAVMARDQDHQARLDQDDLDQLARIARKLL